MGDETTADKGRLEHGRFTGTLLIRLTPEQRKLVDQAAELEGSTVSAWVRRVLVVEARRAVRAGRVP